MPKFTLSVMRTTTHTTILVVEAENEDEACDKILDYNVSDEEIAKLLSDADWDLDDETYEVATVTEGS